jgi:sarcosine oxidase subunit beta
MSDKTIVCRCEDVTLEELRAGLERGYTTIEELKRFTGLGTGPCQGKECQAHVAHLLARVDVPAERIAPFTARPPFAPTPLRLLAGVPPTLIRK